MKKQDSKNKKKKNAKKVPANIQPAQPMENESENPLDFGGLPKRDLKKNLGCG